MITANLEFSIAITLLAAIVFAGILGLIFRGRDRNQRTATLTSEQLDAEARAVTHIHQGDDVARIG